MADFFPHPINAKDINGGVEFANGESPSANAMNDAINGVLYVQSVLSSLLPSTAVDNLFALGAQYKAFGDCGFFPRVNSEGQDEEVHIRTDITYTRTGVKRGKLQIDFLSPNDLSYFVYDYNVISIQKVNNILQEQFGISLYVSESEIGICIPTPVTKTTISNIFGYGMACKVLDNDVLQICSYESINDMIPTEKSVDTIAGVAFHLELDVTEV